MAGRRPTFVDQSISTWARTHCTVRATPSGCSRNRVPVHGSGPKPGRGLLLEGGQSYPLPRGVLSLLGSRLFTLREKARLIRLLATLHAGRCTTARSSPALHLGRRNHRFRQRRIVPLALFRVSTYACDWTRLSAGVAIDQLKLALHGNVWYLDGGWQTLVDGLRPGRWTLAARSAPELGSKAFLATRAAFPCICIAGKSCGAAPPSLLSHPRRPAICSGCLKTHRWPCGLRGECPSRRRVGRGTFFAAAARYAIPLGLDGPFYFSVHSAAANLAPGGIAVVHAMKNLGGETNEPPAMIEQELENLLDRIQPGWRERTVVKRDLPSMTVTHALPTAAENGLFGRPWRPSRVTRMSFSPATGSVQKGCSPTHRPPVPERPPGVFSRCSRNPAPIRIGSGFMSPSDPVFEEYRPVLARLAYRMLGSITDTDDVLQEAYLRWTGASQSAVRRRVHTFIPS